MEDSQLGTNKHELLRGIVHNNIWITLTDNRILRFEIDDADWRTALDFNAYDWSSSSAPFRWGSLDSYTIQEFALDSGLETHGIGINRVVCFPNFPAAPIPHQTFLMASQCPAIDAGILIPGFNDEYLGAAPDMGPLEYGDTAPHFGPRPATLAAPTNLRIALTNRDNSFPVGSLPSATENLFPQRLQRTLFMSSDTVVPSAWLGMTTGMGLGESILGGTGKAES